jgi:hypothetical protein
VDEWLDREGGAWNRAFSAALDQAIEHLQIVIFDEGMESLVAAVGSPEAALRESVLHFERGLGQLFAMVRASGAPPDAVGWSTLKAGYRRAALEGGVEITLRTALETGMYAAESTKLGDHALYRSWSRAVMHCVARRIDASEPYPSAGTDEERLYWAYQVLADLEDHDAFHREVVECLRAEPDAYPVDAIIAHQASLLGLPRFDLILNTVLLWLADAGSRIPEVDDRLAP